LDLCRAIASSRMRNFSIEFDELRIIHISAEASLDSFQIGAVPIPEFAVTGPEFAVTGQTS
jgi:hypothetical protein